MSNTEAIKKALSEHNITLSKEELSKIDSNKAEGGKHSRPYISKVYIGYPDIQTKKRLYYMAEIIDPEPEKLRPLYLSIFFGDVFTTDISKALAGRDTSLPYLVNGPFMSKNLDENVPIVGFEFDAPSIPYNNNLIVYNKDGSQQPGKHQMNVVGTAILWSAECDSQRYGSESPADEKATIYDRRLFTTKISSDA